MTTGCVFWKIVVIGLYWWHPVVWWALREIHEAEEQCCDAWVVWVLAAGGAGLCDGPDGNVDFLPRPSLSCRWRQAASVTFTI